MLDWEAASWAHAGARTPAHTHAVTCANVKPQGAARPESNGPRWDENKEAKRKEGEWKQGEEDEGVNCPWRMDVREAQEKRRRVGEHRRAAERHTAPWPPFQRFPLFVPASARRSSQQNSWWTFYLLPPPNEPPPPPPSAGRKLGILQPPLYLFCFCAFSISVSVFVYFISCCVLQKTHPHLQTDQTTKQHNSVTGWIPLC